MRKEEKGITLIALVVTIVVLLILAGVSIAMLTGENGILTQANNAREETDIGEEEEKVGLAAISAYTKGLGKEIEMDNLKTELGYYFEEEKYTVTTGVNDDGIEGYVVTITENNPNGRTYFVGENGNVTEYIAKKPAEPSGETNEDFIKANGVIEVVFLKGKGYSPVNVANHPIVKEENGMKAITYNESGEPQYLDNSSGTDWYSYVENTDSDMTDGGTTNGGNSQWANAEVTVDGNKSYFVWIPRYAYRIIYFDSLESENAYRAGEITEEEAKEKGKILGYSDARGIVDAEGRQVKGIAQTTAISVNDKYFKTHPAFDGDVNYGGWSNRLERNLGSKI